MEIEISDHGPIYTETHSSGLELGGLHIVEPWNAFSNILFLAIIIYWSWKTKLSFRQFPMVVWILPLLFIGFVGGTLYHASRSANLWLVMDYMPIFIITLSAAVQFWFFLIRRLITSILLTFLCILTPRVLLGMFDLPMHILISIGYGSIAFGLLLPAYLISYRNAWYGSKHLSLAVLFFAVALAARTLDLEAASFLPMGSHFLWHLFGAASVHMLITYVYELRQKLA